MNNKGLTLVEVIAVLVILSIIALIVTPNVTNSVADYKERTLETQLSSVKGALKNWTADNINKVTCGDGNTALYVTLKKLQDDAYLDYEIKNPYGGYLDDSDAFGLVSCKVVEDETKKVETNYMYNYGSFLDIEDYVKKMAIEYVKNNSNSTSNVTVATLKNNGYIYTTITKLDGSVLTIPSQTVHVKVEAIEEGKFKYTATFN